MFPLTKRQAGNDGVHQILFMHKKDSDVIPITTVDSKDQLLGPIIICQNKPICVENDRMTLIPGGDNFDQKREKKQGQCYDDDEVDDADYMSYISAGKSITGVSNAGSKTSFGKFIQRKSQGNDASILIASEPKCESQANIECKSIACSCCESDIYQSSNLSLNQLDDNEADGLRSKDSKNEISVTGDFLIPDFPPKQHQNIKNIHLVCNDEADESSAVESKKTSSRTSSPANSTRKEGGGGATSSETVNFERNKLKPQFTSVRATVPKVRYSSSEPSIFSRIASGNTSSRQFSRSSEQKTSRTQSPTPTSGSSYSYSRVSSRSRGRSSSKSRDTSEIRGQYFGHVIYEPKLKLYPTPTEPSSDRQSVSETYGLDPYHLDPYHFDPYQPVEATTSKPTPVARNLSDMHSLKWTYPSAFCNVCRNTKVPRDQVTLRPRKPCTSDPVALYQYYKNEWDHFKVNIPGDCTHSDVRWRIRNKLLNPDL